MPGNLSDRWRAQIRRAFNFTYDLWRSGVYGVDGGIANILKVNSDGEIDVNVITGGGGGGEQYALDAPWDAADLGTMALGLRNEDLTSYAGAEAEYSPLATDRHGRLIPSHVMEDQDNWQNENPSHVAMTGGRNRGTSDANAELWAFGVDAGRRQYVTGSMTSRRGYDQDGNLNDHDSFTWEFSTSLSAPASGEFRTDTGDLSSGTELRIHYNHQSGVSVDSVMGFMRAGDEILVEAVNDASLSWRLHLTDTPTDNTTYYSFSYLLAARGRGDDPSNLTDYHLSFIFASATPLGGQQDAAASAGGAGSISQKMRRLTSDMGAVKIAVEKIDDWDESDRAKVNPIAGQAGVAAGAGDVDALTQRTTLADDDPAVAGIQALVQTLLLGDESTFATLYQYDSTLDVTPDTGDVQFDAASSAIGNVTTLYFNDTDDLGSTASVRDRVQNGTIIYLRAQTDDHKWVAFVATGDGTDTTGEWSVAVSSLGRGRVDLADDDVCVCYFARLGDAPSLQAQPSINEVWYSGAKYTVESDYAETTGTSHTLQSGTASTKIVLLRAHVSNHGTTDVVFYFESASTRISQDFRVAGSGGGGMIDLFIECGTNEALEVVEVSGDIDDMGINYHWFKADV